MFHIIFFVVFFSKHHLDLIYVFSEILLQFKCSFEQLGFLSMKFEKKRNQRKNRLKTSLLLLLVYCKIYFIFESLAKENCICSSISLLLIGDKSLVDELRCLTSIDLHLHAESYGKNCCLESTEWSQRDWFVNI